MPNIEKYLKKIEGKREKGEQIRGIDYIYVINLDHRQEKLEKSLKQFKQYGLAFQRFPAIYGWNLSQEVFDDIGMKFLPPMDFMFDNQVFFKMESDQRGTPQKLDASSYGKTCVHKGTSAGSLGGTLSHLSCIQDAYDSGYETAWILEDDFTFESDPRLLTQFIDRLDELTNRNWDMLYTDDDHYFPPRGKMNIYLRPDRSHVDHVYEHTPLGKDFFKTGGRWQLHSVIYRRSGMKKVLDYIKQYGLFHTFDVEVNYTPGIQMYNLRWGLVHGRNRTVSDTQMEYFSK
ncbi:MAG: glycosyltransferase family 25 protein [Verrucomicrobia bacterium]|nr:glycosyltransferase family 25 protein [Verrucomicrobiota bacterium]